MIIRSLLNVVWPLNLGSLLNTAAGIITIIHPIFGFNFLNSVPTSTKWTSAICIGLIFFIGRFLFVLNRNINSMKDEISNLRKELEDKNIWGESIKSLRTAYSHIHLLRKRQDFDKASFMRSMIDFCDELQSLYNLKTHSQCCVSIKVAAKKVTIDEANELNNLVFENLCRDSHHPARDNQRYKEIQHTVLGNTPYRSIIGDMLKNRYTEGEIIELGFIHNSVKKDINYRTTSLPSYDNNEIPYNSELVYPIIPYRRPNTNKYIMLGFICIDCKDEEKFSKTDYEMPMVSGIADGIYDLLLSYLNAKKWN